LDQIRLNSTAQRLFLMEWEADGQRGVNHYLYGSPPFDPVKYREWLGKIAALDGSFEAERAGE